MRIKDNTLTGGVSLYLNEIESLLIAKQKQPTGFILQESLNENLVYRCSYIFNLPLIALISGLMWNHSTKSDCIHGKELILVRDFLKRNVLYGSDQLSHILMDLNYIESDLYPQLYQLIFETNQVAFTSEFINSLAVSIYYIGFTIPQCGFSKYRALIHV